MRPLRAVLVERATPRLVELLAAALDGTGPAILPLDAGLPAGRLAELIAALGPGSIEDAEGVTTVRSAHNEGVAEGTAVVVGTSGSTGTPKGVELSAAALRHSARASLDRVGARPGERWLCCLPATHVAGLQVLVRSLVSGSEPVLAERADAETVAGSGCAHVSLVPTQLQRLLEAGPADAAGRVLLGAARRRRGARQPARGGAGRGRAGGDDLRHDRDLRRLRVRRGSAGRRAGRDPRRRDDSPADGADLDRRAGAVLRVPGAAGRPRRRCATAWFRTGDLGRLDSSGRLVVRGRADDVINTGGHKVVPGEVAAALQTCPGVRDVAVVGQPDPEWGERVIAVVVPADPADPPALELLRLHVRERLPRYAAPSRVVMVDAVPMLPSGKHDIVRLRQELLRREQTEAENVT